jgi:hypothetical protein
MSRKDKNRPVPSSPPSPKQAPRRSPGPAKERPRCLHGIDDEPGNGHPVWRLALLDLEHDDEWSWSIREGALRKIITFLRDMEHLTWKEIRNQQTGGHRRRGAKHKFIPAAHLCPAAQRRLLDLQLDEFDELFRFRLGNLERLWGVTYGDVFYPVWWDPEHKVCPGQDPN